jgi:hypothetical protein
MSANNVKSLAGRLKTWFWSKGPWAAFGCLLGGVATPLFLKGASLVRDIPDIEKTAPMLYALAAAIGAHPVLASALQVLVCVGVVLLFSDERNPRDLKIAGVFSWTVSDPLRRVKETEDRARALQARAEEVVEDFAAINLLIQRVAADPTEDRVKKVLEEICAMGSRALSDGHTLQASVWQPCEEGGRRALKISASFRVSITTVQTLRVAPGYGFAGQVFQSGSPKVIADTSVVTEADYATDPVKGRAAMTIMGLPVFAGDGSGPPSAVICFSQSVRRGARPFDETDLLGAQPYAILAGLTLTAGGKGGGTT